MRGDEVVAALLTRDELIHLGYHSSRGRCMIWDFPFRFTHGEELHIDSTKE